MVDEVKAVYRKTGEVNPFYTTRAGARDIMKVVVSAGDLKGFTEDEIIAMAKENTKEGYEFVRLEGLEKVPGLELKAVSED